MFAKQWERCKQSVWEHRCDNERGANSLCENTGVTMRAVWTVCVGTQVWQWEQCEQAVRTQVWQWEVWTVCVSRASGKLTFLENEECQSIIYQSHVKVYVYICYSATNMSIKKIKLVMLLKPKLLCHYLTYNCKDSVFK